MKNKSILIVYFLLSIFSTSFYGQIFFTEGNKSPIINGTKAYLEYNNSVTTSFDIPDELAPLLAGLLLANNKSLEEAQPALEVWIKKYNELDKKIEQHQNVDKRARAREALQRGDFMEVGSILQLSSDYDDLIQTFSNTYGLNRIQTSGEQSPIIIGDHASINYVVHQVIKYKLPEGLTVNMLGELSTVKNENQKLTADNKSKEQVILDWISRYQALKRRLKNTPGEVAQEAYKWYRLGNLDKAQAVLKKVDGNRKEIGEVSFLHAKILELQINLTNYDEYSKKILKYYQQAASLTENLEIQLRYSSAIGEFTGDFNAALRALEEAKKYLKDNKDRFDLLRNESYLYVNIGNVEIAEKLATEALNLATEMPAKEDSVFLYALIVLQTQMANILNQKADLQNPAFQTQISELVTPNEGTYKTITDLYNKSLYYDSLALNSLLRWVDLYELSEDYFLNSLIVSKNNIALRAAKVKPLQESAHIYESTYNELKKIYNGNPELTTLRYILFLNAYHDYLINIGNLSEAKSISAESVEAAIKVVSLENKGTFMYYSFAIERRIISLGFENELLDIYNLVAQRDSVVQLFYAVDSTFFMPFIYPNQLYLAGLAYRTGYFQEAEKLCERLIDVYDASPAPVPNLMQVAVHSITALSVIGYSVYFETEQYQKGLAFLGKVKRIYQKFKTTGTNFHPLIGGRMLQLEVGEIGLRAKVEHSYDYSSALKNILNTCQKTVGIDPDQVVNPFIHAATMLTEINSERGIDFQDTMYVAQAKSFAINYVPAKYAIQMASTYAKLDNDILKNAIIRDKSDLAREYKELIEYNLQNYYSKQSEFIVYKNLGEESLYFYRVELLRADSELANYHYNLAKKEKDIAAKQIYFDRVCLHINRAQKRIADDWQVKLIDEVRESLMQMSIYCGCN